MKKQYKLQCKYIFFICLQTILFKTLNAQLPVNVNKTAGISITGTAIASGTEDWIYDIKMNSSSSMATGYVYNTSSSPATQNPNCIKVSYNNSVATPVYEKVYPAIEGIGCNIISSQSAGTFIFGLGTRTAQADPPSIFSIKINEATGALDQSYGSGGIKVYNPQNLTLSDLMAPVNEATTTIFGYIGTRMRAKEIVNNPIAPFINASSATPTTAGFIICGNYINDTLTPVRGITNGCYLLKLDANGNPDVSWGNQGILNFHINGSGTYENIQVNDVCVNYDASGSVSGYCIVGSVAEDIYTLPYYYGFARKDAFFMSISANGTVQYIDVFDETTHRKNSSSPYSVSYTDVSDRSYCTNWGILNANGPDTAFFLTQENTNQRATRVIQMGFGGDFVICAQFDYTAYYHASPCSNNYPSTGFFLTADPAILRISRSNGNILWKTNILPSSGADFDNDLIFDEDNNSKIMVLGSTQQEPDPGTPTYQHAVISKLDPNNGSIIYQRVYNDVSSSQTMFCPFTFGNYRHKMVIAGDNNINGDDYQYIWIENY